MSFASITRGMEQQKKVQRQTRAENARLYAEYVQNNPSASVEERERFRDSLSKDGFYTALIPNREQMTKNVAESQKKLAAQAQQRQLETLQRQTQTRELLTDQIADALITSPDYETASQNYIKTLDPDAAASFQPIIENEATRNAAVARATQKALEQNADRIEAGLLQGYTPEQIAGTLGIKNSDIQSAVGENYKIRYQQKEREIRDQITTELLEAASSSATNEIYQARKNAIFQKHGIYAQNFPTETIEQIDTGHQKRMEQQTQAERTSDAQVFNVVNQTVTPEELLRYDNFEEVEALYAERMSAAGRPDFEAALFKDQMRRRWELAQEQERIKLAEEANIKRPQEAAAKYNAGLSQTEETDKRFKSIAEKEIARAVPEDDQKASFGAINIAYTDWSSRFGLEHTPEFQRDFVLAITETGGATEGDVLEFIQEDEAFGEALHERLMISDPAYAKTMQQIGYGSLTRIKGAQEQAAFRKLYRANRTEHYVDQMGGRIDYFDPTNSQAERTQKISGAISTLEGEVAKLAERVEADMPQTVEEAEDLAATLNKSIQEITKKVILASRDLNDLREFQRTEEQTAEIKALETKIGGMIDQLEDYQGKVTQVTRANIVELTADQRDQIARGQPQFTPAQLEALTPRAQQYAQIMSRGWLMGKERHALANIRFEVAKVLGLDPRRDQELIDRALQLVAQQPGRPAS